MLFLALLLVAVPPEPRIPSDVELRGKRVLSETFRVQAKPILKAPTAAPGPNPAAYVEGTIEKVFPEALHVAVTTSAGKKFILPVDVSGLGGGPHQVGDTLRVFGVLRPGPKLFAYWWEPWIPELEITCKLARKPAADGARTVSGTIVNRSERSILSVKLHVALGDAKGGEMLKELVSIGDLDPGASIDFSVPFKLPDNAARQALLPAARIWTCEKAPADEKTKKAEKDSSPKPLLAALERRLLFHPAKYKDADIAGFLGRGGVRLDFTAGKLKQTAWLIPPAGGATAEKLWVCCGGNAALALRFESLCRGLPFQADAYLLVDYPGYGACDGDPDPAGIRANVKEAVALAASKLNLDLSARPDSLAIFGHSLGCAAALFAVEDFGCSAAVLCAPFTSTLEMAQLRLGVGKNYPIQNRFDNRAPLARLSKSGGRAWILHGDGDEVIPHSMSQSLADEFPAVVTLSVISGAGHNDLLRRGRVELLAAFRAAREHRPKPSS
jgi:pimeloyl-ACP methyl ester carboxylesterase